ncbi:MAG: GNAT family N-acetyltransferase [Burkholderiales bacterium]
MNTRSKSLREHVLDASHLPGCLALSAEAGWNQIEADWRLMLGLGLGLGVSTADGRLVATTIMLPYGRRFGWISMVLVTADFRRRGIAKRLLRRAVDELVGGGHVPLLDATPAGREVYCQLGFEDCWGMQRFASASGMAPAAAREHDLEVRRHVPDDWTRVLEFDRAVFGADRSGILRNLAMRVPSAALVAERNGRFCGASFARDGRVATQIGPVIAADEETALALIAAALAKIPAPVFIDVPDRHARIAAWLRATGFAPQRSLTRMARQRNRAFDDLDSLFAIAGPELG